MSSDKYYGAVVATSGAGIYIVNILCAVLSPYACIRAYVRLLSLVSVA